MDQTRPEKSNGRAADYSPCPSASPGGARILWVQYVKNRRPRYICSAAIIVPQSLPAVPQSREVSEWRWHSQCG
jgi:hypothetical protein